MIAVVFIVLKTRGGTLSHDLTPGNIYTGDKQQDHHMPADEEKGTDDFTFYKVLNSKEGDITPLDVEPEKSTIEKEQDVEVLHEEKMSKIDGEIVRKIVNEDFWNAETNFFNYGKLPDNTYNEERTNLPSVPLYFNLADREKAAGTTGT